MDIADHWLFSSGNRYVLATNRKLKVTTPRPNLALQAAAYHEAGSRPGRRNLGVVLRSRCTYYAYRFTAASQHWISTLRKSPPLTASRISFPVIGTMSVSSRLPRSISFVTVEVNPFHEIKKPRLHRRCDSQSFPGRSRLHPSHTCRSNSCTPLRAERIPAEGEGHYYRLRLKCRSPQSPCGRRPPTVNPGTVSNSLLHNSSRLRPLSSVV